MFSFIRERLALKLLIPVCLVIMIGFGGLVLYVVNSTTDLVYAEATQGAMAVATSTANSLTTFIKEQRLLASLLADHADVRNAIMGDGTMATEMCKKMVQDNPDIWGVLVYDVTGQVMATYDADEIGKVDVSVADRDYVKQTLAGVTGYLSDTVTKSEGSDAYYYSISQPARDWSGNVLGGVTILCSWNSFVDKFISHVKIGDKGYGFVLDTSGRFISHPEPGVIGTDASAHGFTRQALEQASGIVHYDWEGREKVVAFGTDPLTGWTVCMSAYVDDLASGAISQQHVLTVVGIVLTLMVVGVCLLMFHFFVFRPVRKTVELANATAKGDLAEDFKADATGDEIDRMQASLVNIRSTVRSMTAEFQRVADRIQKGSLNERGATEGVEGDYARLIGNGNHMLDVLVTVINELPLPLLAISPEHEIRFMNHAAAKAGGADAKSFEGTRCHEFFRSGDCRSDACACRKAMKTGKIAYSSTEANPGGNEMHADYFGMPLVDGDGKTVGAIKVTMDQTHIRKAQKKMMDTAGQADSVASMLSAASQELTAQVEQTLTGANRQQSMATEVATAMEQMNGTVLEIARNASEASIGARDMRKNAVRGGEAVGHVVQSIERVRSRAKVLDENIVELGSKAKSIGAVMTVINDIADQTNLLALNAAIEAARAGDAGRGFAVVADEVRKLAEKTMDATHEVSTAIKSIQDGITRNVEAVRNANQAIDESTKLASDAGDALGDILTGAERADEQIGSIATASEEQAAASNEITDRLGVVTDVSDEIAGAMNESAQAVADLARLAEELQQVTMSLSSSDDMTA